jgi:hypothetical protein
MQLVTILYNTNYKIICVIIYSMFDTKFNVSSGLAKKDKSWQK